MVGKDDPSLSTVLRTWVSGAENHRDMRRYLVARLGGAVYLYREVEEVRVALRRFAKKYNSPEHTKLRVFRTSGILVNLARACRFRNQAIWNISE